MGDRHSIGEAEAEAGAVQQSLFGRGEQLSQISRLMFPDGLAWRGVGVAPKTLKHVLERVDSRDRGGQGGRGCFASAQTLADEMQISKKTVDRALNVLTHVLGFLTHQKHHVGLRTIVERRVCFPAIRAFNDGEQPNLPERGEGRGVPGEGRGVPGEGRGVPEVRDARVPLSVTNRKELETKRGSGGGGLLSFGPGVTVADLGDAQRLLARFRDAVAAGLVFDCEVDRLAVVAWGMYCLREARDPVRLFVSGLRGRRDPYGRTWREKPTQADEERARQILRRADGLSPLRSPPSALNSPSSALAPAERIRQLWRDSDPTLVKRAARMRLGRDSLEYRDFIAAWDAGGLDDVPDALLLRMLGGRDACRVEVCHDV